MGSRRDAYIEAHSLEFDLENSDCKDCYNKHLECSYYYGECRNEVWNINNWGVVWMIDKRFKVHSMIQDMEVGEIMDLELCEELIKKYGSLSDIHLLIEDNGNDMTYQMRMSS